MITPRPDGLMPPYHRREQLQARYPDWEIWYRHRDGGMTWYARREGMHLKPLQAPKADQLAELIEAVLAADASREDPAPDAETPAR